MEAIGSISAIRPSYGFAGFFGDDLMNVMGYIQIS
jgi:hypothetical protein